MTIQIVDTNIQIKTDHASYEIPEHLIDLDLLECSKSVTSYTILVAHHRIRGLSKEEAKQIKQFLKDNL